MMIDRLGDCGRRITSSLCGDLVVKKGNVWLFIQLTFDGETRIIFIFRLWLESYAEAGL